MKTLIALTLLLSGISAHALTDVTDTFAGPFRVGRMDRLQGMFELKDMELPYTYTTKAGKTVSMMVKAAVDISSFSTSQEGDMMTWLAEQKRNYVMITIFYAPDGIDRTDNCLGSEFIYKVEDEDGNDISTCFTITPSSVISE
jgi:hypothetical protein